MYETSEEGHKKWKMNETTAPLLSEQKIYQESLQEQFEGVDPSLYEIMPPSVG